MKFLDFLKSKDQFYINKDDPFLIHETLNSSFNIIRKEKSKTIENTVLYYIDVNGKDYRIFIERNKDDIHIGFERFKNDEWHMNIQTNDLSAKELLGIFGTIKILLSQRFKSIYIYTDDSKKFTLYRKIILKLNSELNLNFGLSTDDKSFTLYTKDGYKPKHSFLKNKIF